MAKFLVEEVNEGGFSSFEPTPVSTEIQDFFLREIIVRVNPNSFPPQILTGLKNEPESTWKVLEINTFPDRRTFCLDTLSQLKEKPPKIVVTRIA